ncbi:MAG: hypothetical protein GY774_19310 [Planctomycetes bacterium]|nr:hypothetical protein [Planctomycetota bacterium]
MRVSGIIHQQICQLKWHLLACLGLIMVLPIEEAIVSLKAGDGFFCTNMTFAAILFGPLLAGLIACVNVQCDLNEKRYIFWRSKPANVKLLITLKFFIGLIVSLIILACPVFFALLSNLIWNEEGIERAFFKYYMPALILISIMTYSLCFACNVVVRKTARAWLIGMLIGCFLLVLPFMLPLDYKDYMHDIILWSLGPSLIIMLIAPAAAFVFSLYAAKQDWHLKTNLKGLLWVGAGLAFALLMLFSSQVANIKVLQEKEIGSSRGRRTLDYAGSQIIFHGDNYGYINTGNKSISLQKIGAGDAKAYPYGNLGADSTGRRIHYGPSVVGYHEMIYPKDGKLLYKNAGNDIFFFSIHAFYRKEEEGASVKTFYEKVYLRSYEHTGNNWMPICELDISDCLMKNNRFTRIAMRLIDNRLFARVNDSFVIVDTMNPGELKIIDKKLDILQRYRPFTYIDRKKEFSIPLVPIEEIGFQEKIRLSIDLNYHSYYGDSSIYESSIVDIHDGKFTFAFVEHDEVARYDVIRWDDEKIYCKFSASRPYTILEGVTSTPGFFNPKFVKNGKLYLHNYNTLMVFDFRSNRSIRKLGHFVRMNYNIEDIAVLEDDNIVLCMRLYQDQGLNAPNEQKWYLYLLKNPE